MDIDKILYAMMIPKECFGSKENNDIIGVKSLEIIKTL